MMEEVRRRIFVILYHSSFKFLVSFHLCYFATVHIQEVKEYIGLESRQLVFGVGIQFVPLLLYFTDACKLVCFEIGAAEELQFVLVYAVKDKVHIFHCCVRISVVMLIGNAV